MTSDHRPPFFPFVFGFSIQYVHWRPICYLRKLQISNVFINHNHFITQIVYLPKLKTENSVFSNFSYSLDHAIDICGAFIWIWMVSGFSMCFISSIRSLTCTGCRSDEVDVVVVVIVVIINALHLETIVRWIHTCQKHMIRCHFHKTHKIFVFNRNESDFRMMFTHFSPSSNSYFNSRMELNEYFSIFDRKSCEALKVFLKLWASKFHSHSICWLLHFRSAVWILSFLKQKNNV